jgi:hypothetical protein
MLMRKACALALSSVACAAAAMIAPVMNQLTCTLFPKWSCRNLPLQWRLSLSLLPHPAPIYLLGLREGGAAAGERLAKV